MIFVHWWAILYSFNQESGITSDRNNVSNWFRSNEYGTELFSIIVRYVVF